MFSGISKKDQISRDQFERRIARMPIRRGYPLANPPIPPQPPPPLEILNHRYAFIEKESTKLLNFLLFIE